MKVIKKHLAFIVYFGITIVLFLYPLLRLHSGFLNGDYFVQFLPWLKTYHATLRQLAFPFWAQGIQSGFPLVAEGQLGAFYPLNILLFGLLPFRLAYNYSFVLHFILGGIFIYLYSRKLGADQLGGYLAALIFCFGSAYAGCLYNIVGLRTLVWFPLQLYLMECYFEKLSMKYAVLAGLASGFQFLAGSFQIALYSVFFAAFYFLGKGFAFRSRLKRELVSFLFVFLGLAILLALPQALLTSRLVSDSNRAQTTLSFALWGSFSPLGFLGLIFPNSVLFSRSSFYLGVFSMLFITIGIYLMREKRQLRLPFLCCALSIFLALGGYNPIYIVAIKFFNLLSFRVPARFLLFSTVWLAVLAGCGFTVAFDDSYASVRKRATLAFRRLIYIYVSVFLVIKFTLMVLGNRLIMLGQWYMEQFVIGKWHHRHGSVYYIEKLRSLINSLRLSFSFKDQYFLISLVLCIFGVMILPRLVQRKQRLLILMLLSFDLFIFGFNSIGFRREIKPFSCVVPESARLYRIIRSDKELFRIMPFGLVSNKLPNWSVPNANMLYGIDSIGCYAPLASRRYRDALAGLEVVDDSLGLNLADDMVLAEKLDLLRLLNVKYIVSYRSLNYDFLKKVAQEEGVYLYEIRDYCPRIFFTEKLSENVRPEGSALLNLLEIRGGYAAIKLATKNPGFVIFSEWRYSGWQVFVDNKKKELIVVKDLIQAVAVGGGEHEIVFRFTPQF